MGMDREFSDRLESMQKDGEVILRTSSETPGKWLCSWYVGTVYVEGWGFSVETAVEMAIQEMKKQRHAEKLARETSAAVRAYLYNPRRLLR